MNNYLIDEELHFTPIPNEIILISKTWKPNTFKLYVILKSYAYGNKDTVFPSLKTIEDKSGITKKTIIECMKDLVNFGIVEVHKKKKDAGGYLSNFYILKSVIITPNPSVKTTLGVVYKLHPNKTREKKTIYTIVSGDIKSPEIETFSFKKKLEELLKSKTEYVTIMACYWNHKDMDFPTKKAYNSAYKRNLIPAQTLVGYKDKDFFDTLAYLDRQNYKWTLETVLKVIPEIKTLKNKK